MNTVSNKQLSVMIFFIPLAFKAAMLPSLLYKECGSDFYVGIGLVTVAEILQLILILRILSLGGFDGIEQRYGPIAKRVLALPFLLSMSIKCLIFVTEIYYYVTRYLFYNISALPIIGALMIALFYISSKGAKTIGRIFELSIWLVPLIVLFGIFFGKGKFCGVLTPLFDNGFRDVAIGIDKYLIYAFDFSPLLFFKADKVKKSSVAVASALSVAAVVGTYIIFLLSYGRSSFLISEAFARLASFNTVISEIGALDWPSALLWLTVCVCNVALKFCAIGEIGAYFNIKRNISLFIAVVAVGCILIFLLDTFQKTLDFVTGPIRYAVVATEIVVPIILAIMLSKKSKEIPVEQEN